MIIDGKLIAHELKTKLKERTYEIDPHLSLGIIVTEETPATKQFVTIKQAFGKNINVDTEVLKLGQLEQDNENLLELILHASRKYDGVILQLPIPPHFELSSVLNIYPFTQDVDVIGNAAYQQFKEGSLPFLPPVVGAFAEILHKSEVRLTGKNVLVVGEGRLVGAPSAVWAKRLGAYVTVATKETENLSELTKKSDVIILGAGVPNLLTPEMIKQDVIILDAGSGNVDGKVFGDASPECADKASVFTPTPGGVGPITVAKLFENLVALDDLKKSKHK
jgi:methylenetetrahydrofolate dehydrogenase (NADP+)/methenyltetrahydrofolate cyclohydrolase